MSSSTLAKRLSVSEVGEHAEEHPSVLAMPSSSAGRVFFFATLPMVLCFYCTTSFVTQ